jgi:hypothetical protein
MVTRLRPHSQRERVTKFCGEGMPKNPCRLLDYSHISCQEECKAKAKQPVNASHFGTLGTRSFGADRGTGYDAGMADGATFAKIHAPAPRRIDPRAHFREGSDLTSATPAALQRHVSAPRAGGIFAERGRLHRGALEDFRVALD